MGMAPNIDLMLRGMSGLATLCYLAGLLYFSFTLMRVRRGRAAEVFFWAVTGQVLGTGLLAVMSLGTGLLGRGMPAAGVVNWAGIMGSVMPLWVLLSSLTAAVALVVSVAGGARR